MSFIPAPPTLFTPDAKVLYHFEYHGLAAISSAVAPALPIISPAFLTSSRLSLAANPVLPLGPFCSVSRIPLGISAIENG